MLAFNLSVVDVAILLGPGNPPTYAVFLLSLVNDPGSRSVASAGALFLAAGVVFIYCLVFMIERVTARIAGQRRQSGHRGTPMQTLRKLGQSLAVTLQLISIAALVLLLLWSFARRWRFPSTLPTEWTGDHWLNRASEFSTPLLTTLSIALMTLLLSLAAAIAWLECERRNALPRLDWLWYVPLLIPQVTLLFGWQAMALLTGADGKWLTVVYSHWVYALPYVVLLLAVAWRELDPNWNHAASVLGSGYWRTLFAVRIPLLIKPVSQAAAVAMAVSVAQYLPTLLLGAGRHQTLAIELVTSFAGVDRRIIATLAAMQSLLPLLAFGVALWLPKLLQHKPHE